MELILEGFSYYAIFCITTAICIVGLNVKAFRTVGFRWSFSGGLIYYGTTIPIVLVGAPAFFIVFIFRSDVYYESLITYIAEIYLDPDDKS
jgi:hypothetical protein